MDLKMIRLLYKYKPKTRFNAKFLHIMICKWHNFGLYIL